MNSKFRRVSFYESGWRRPARPRCRGERFTLVEAMIAMFVSCLVLTAVLSLYSYSLNAYRRGAVRWQMAQQLRLAREKILRSVDDGYYGLREGERATVQIFPGGSNNVEWIDFDVDGNASPTPDRGNDNVGCRIQTNPGHVLCAKTTPGNGRLKPLVSDNVTVNIMDIEQNSESVDIDLEFDAVVGGVSIARRHVMRVRMAN